MVTGEHEFAQWFQRVIHGGVLLANVSTGSLLQHPWGLFLIDSAPSPTTITKRVLFEQALKNCFRYKISCYVKPTCIPHPLRNEGASSSSVDDVNCQIIRKLLRILFLTNEYFCYPHASAKFRHTYICSS
jgi:hypothetical protein